MSQATARKRPDWDLDGVAEPYLISLREEAREGRFDAAHVNEVMALCVRELKATYQSQNVDRALEGLSRILTHIEWQAGEARAMSEAVPQIAPDLEAPQRLAGPTTLKALDSAREWLKASPDHLRPLLPIARSASGYLKNRVAVLQDNFQTRAPQLHRNSEGSRAEKADRPLNGRALTKSVVPTWMMLVGASWLGLIWTAIITTPIGIGLGIFASMLAGFLVVPLWGTLFGFLGMGAARTATLRQMSFNPLPPNDPLHHTAARFSAELGIPAPELGAIPVFNAFAMGNSVNSATVAIGDPLRGTLTPAEVDAVLGHELGHVVSGDMRRMMLMRTFQNATVWFMLFNGAKQFARWAIGWVAELFILRFSRKREYWADAIGAALAGKEAMIGALLKLDAAPPLSGAENTHARFMVRGRVSGLLSTHPTVQQRIDALASETYLKRLPRRRG